MPPASFPFDMSALNVFLAVCENGSMASAARSLGITQPAVSQTIADLEARTATMLFDRRVRPLALTATGTVLRQYASNLVSDMHHIAMRLREMQTGRVSQLRIGVVDSLSRALLVNISRFMQTRAEHLIVLAGLTESHAEALLTRQIDFIVGVDDLEDVPGLERWPLFEEPYLLVCNADIAPPSSREELREICSQHPFVRFTLRSRSGTEIERYLRRMQIDVPLGQEYDLPIGLLAGCHNGGIAISTPLCLHEAGYMPDQGLCVHPLPAGGIKRRLTLVARRREFGRLPLDFAQMLRTSLQDYTRTVLHQRFAAFAQSMTVLS
ncbi:LysR family transcriptional regulator [Komagataeibacter nataicola]|uniref:LysR family transcriptional regulator n=2 Tax=Komagataeibacter nataicola TaxID=265960 RepID=A0A9N7CN44_9PROT|nr:LysR family transcriptional regulator [Komagataeibacter nataicola]PYD66703.1 LysR family transcriptional regulator [Komagataeibacter nataicola]